MGILDNMTSAMNRGAESMSRATEKSKLKGQLNEVNKKRQNLAAQLGASLYPVTKDDPTLRAGREFIYDSIAACDNERDELQHKIGEIEATNQAAASAATMYKCAVCGANISGADLFCSGCGTPASEAIPAAAVAVPVAGAKTCATCGAPMGADDMFCMSCGTKVEVAE